MEVRANSSPRKCACQPRQFADGLFDEEACEFESAVSSRIFRSHHLSDGMTSRSWLWVRTAASDHLQTVNLRVGSNTTSRITMSGRYCPKWERRTPLRSQHNSWSFRDEEGDLITVRCEEDWAEALDSFQRQRLTAKSSFAVFLDNFSSICQRKSMAGWESLRN